MIRWFAALVVASSFICAGPSIAAPPPLEAYGKLPGMSDVHLSPSGDRYAFVADVGQGRQIYVLGPDKKLLDVVNIGDKNLLGIQWAGEDFVLVDLTTTLNVGNDRVVPKLELSSVVVLDIRRHQQMQVFAKHDTVAPAVFGEYGVARIDGRWFGFFGGESRGYVTGGGGEMDYSNTETENRLTYINADLYRVDLESGDLSLAATGERGSAGWVVGPDGVVVARALHSQKTGAWSVWTGRTLGRELASGISMRSAVDLLGLGRSGDSVLVSHGGDGGTVVEDLPLGGGPAKTVIADGSSDALLVDDVSRRWIGLAADGDDAQYTLFSALSQARVTGARKAFPGYFTRVTSWSEDFGKMVVFTDGKDDSGAYWIVDIATGSASVLGSARPAVHAADVGPVRSIDWTAADGLALHGVLTLPPDRDAKNLPLVVMPHGGPWARDYPGFDYWAQAYASRGYAVFQPNFRGSSGYGPAFLKAGNGEIGRKMQTDISDGVAALARQGVIDAKRACIVGWSYGGYAALAGTTLQHGLYRCVVSTAGVADVSRFFSYLETDAGLETTDTRYWKAFLGDRSRWGDVSPSKHADQADAPILLIHGKDDTVVPIDQSDAMEKALKAAGKPVERLTLAGADHQLLKDDDRVAMLKASVVFVEKYNPPDAPPAAPGGH